MKKIIYDNLHKLIALLCVIVICIAAIFGGGASALADTSTSAAFENQNVLDDLDGSTIAGVEFDLSNYPYDENGRPQVLNFVEFAYSLYSSNRDDFGLYVYVYNPQGYAFDDNSSLNQLEATFGSLNPGTYPLEIINYSTKSGYEGLFYKFKVALSDSQLNSVLSSVSSSARVYTITGLELSVGGTPIDYEVGSTYTYTGYSLGYGSSAATASSLTCKVDGYDNYINLDVTHTTYRPEGDYYEGEQSQLDSVYFTVSNDYFENYGELTNIACEWYEYVTQPMLVTENLNIYNAMNSLYGRSLSNVSGSYDYMFIKFGTSDASWFGKSADAQYASNLTFDEREHYSYNGYTYSVGDDPDANKFDNFAGVFYTGSTSYKNCSVSGEDILAKLRSYSSSLGDTSICGKYAAALFDSDYEASGYSGIVDVSITDTRTLFTNTTTKNWLQNIFGGYSVDTETEDIPALLTFSDSTLFNDYERGHYTYDELSSYDTSVIADTFYIGEADVSDFLATCKTAKANGETVVLMRFASSTYISQPCAQARNSSSDTDSKKTMTKDCIAQYVSEDYSAYVFQETVYLNFDIISLTFTLDGVETVIPVVMTPVDLAGDSTPPLEEDTDGYNWKDIVKLILAILALVLILVILMPVLPYIAKFIVWIISLPFKLIKSIVQAFKNIGKNKKE